MYDIGSGQRLSLINEMNARGQVTKETRGNGALTTNTYDDLTGNLTNQQSGIGGAWSIQNISYKWEKIGNLKYRKNNSPFIGGSGDKNKQESFCYDSLNRLIKTVANVSADYATGNSACAPQDVVYDGFGNIKTKNGVAYEYGTNAGPHAATKVGSATYTYDANGNAISGDGRTFDYTSYDMAAKISRSSTHYTEFKYGPDRARWYREDVKSGSATIKTTYIGNIEKIETVGGDIEWKRYVAGAIFTYKTNTANQVQSKDKSWIYNDHLGSVDVITDNAGIIRQSLGFTPWGERRGGENWSAMTAAQISAALVPSGYSRPITTRGYTGHEMVDDMGIIHMNGRIYDAKIARFLQADPFIQAAGDTQSYNRYSYVRNNPLNATDPSGYNWFKKTWNKIRPFVGAIAGIVVAVLCNGICGAQAYALYMGIAGAAGAAATGGNILQGFVFGALSAGVGGINSWQGFLARGLVGGIQSVAAGGKFGHGFVAAGIGGGIPTTNPVAGFLQAAVIGGAVSEITGGKFKNGAASAAFMYAVRSGVEKIASNASGSRSLKDIEEGTTAEERQERFEEIKKAFSDKLKDRDIEFVDQFAGEEAGSLKVELFNTKKEFLDWFNGSPATRGILEGRTTAAPNRPITLYRGAVLGGRGTILIPGGSITGYFSGIETGIITLGHELWHASAMVDRENFNNKIPHISSNMHGWAWCRTNKMCQKQVINWDK